MGAPAEIYQDLTAMNWTESLQNYIQALMGLYLETEPLRK